MGSTIEIPRRSRYFKKITSVSGPSYQWRFLHCPSLWHYNGNTLTLLQQTTNAYYHSVGSNGWQTLNLFPAIDRQVWVKRNRVEFLYLFHQSPINTSEGYLVIVDTLFIQGLQLPKEFCSNTFIKGPLRFPIDAEDTLVLHSLELQAIEELQIARKIFTDSLYYRFVMQLWLPARYFTSATYPLLLDPLLSMSGSNATACGFGHAVGQGPGDATFCDCLINLVGLGGTQLGNAIWDADFETNQPGNICEDNCGSNPWHMETQAHGWFKVGDPCAGVWDPPDPNIYYKLLRYAMPWMRELCKLLECQLWRLLRESYF